VDHRPGIAQLEKEIANFIKVIGAGEYSPAVSDTLKAAEARTGETEGIHADVTPAGTQGVTGAVRPARQAYA